MFDFKRLILPDHTYKRNLKILEIQKAINIIEDFDDSRPTLIHCVAAVERSPLICMSWLIVKHKLSPHQALDYMMQAHPGTNPLPNQLKLSINFKNMNLTIAAFTKFNLLLSLINF